MTHSDIISVVYNKPPTIFVVYVVLYVLLLTTDPSLRQVPEAPFGSNLMPKYQFHDHHDSQTYIFHARIFITLTKRCLMFIIALIGDEMMGIIDERILLTLSHFRFE